MPLIDSYLSLASAAVGIKIIIEIFVFLIEAIILFKFFEKAGQESWKAIIPIINKVTLLEIANMSPLWAIIPAITLIGNFIELDFLNANITMVASFLSLIVVIAEGIIFTIIINIKIAKKFNLPIIFAIGMMLFPYVFYAIIAWGPFKYTGTRKQKERSDNAFNLAGKDNKDYIPKSDFFRD